MDRLMLKLVGASPILLHSTRGADPLDPMVREFKKVSSVRKKTDELHAVMARMEWELGLYYDPDLGPYLPTTNLRACVIEGAKLSKRGMDLKRGTMVETDRVPLAYKGPREIEKLWDAGTFRDVRAVVVGTARVMRTRPIFRPPWSVEFGLLYDPGVVQRDQLIACAETAGALVGLGDYRPPCGGAFGRFTVEVSP